MPTAEAPGKLKNRDDKKVVNTEKEKVRTSLCAAELSSARAFNPPLLFCSSRPCSSLRKECMSSCPKSVWRRAAAWTSSSSRASTWTWPPWLSCPRTPAALCTNTATSRSGLGASIDVFVNAATCWLKLYTHGTFPISETCFPLGGGCRWRWTGSTS